jgi:hypothetical protein
MMSSSNPATIRNLLLSAILIILLSSIWLVANNYQLSPNSAASSDRAALSMPSIKCDFKKKLCLSKSGLKKVSLTIQTNDIRSFSPLPFKLLFEGITPDHVAIDFQGIEMFMGANILTLTQQRDLSFSGAISLPGHSGHSMTWRAIVTYKTAEKPEQVWFEFVLD